MSTATTTTLVLSKLQKGLTKTIMNKYRFRNGVCTIPGNEIHNATIIQMLAKRWGVHVAGREPPDYYGPNEIPAYADRNAHDQIPANVQSHGTRPAPVRTDHVGGADETQAGAEVRLADRDRREDPGLSEEEQKQGKSILKALSRLDPNNRDHWTATGKPTVEMVTELAGFPVTRNMINLVSPEFTARVAASNRADQPG